MAIAAASAATDAGDFLLVSRHHDGRTRPRQGNRKLPLAQAHECQSFCCCFLRFGLDSGTVPAVATPCQTGKLEPLAKQTYGLSRTG